MPRFLEARQIASGYGKKQVLFGIDLAIGQGEIVAIIGANGSGKSTVLKTLFGLLPLWSGSIHWKGEQLRQPDPPGLLQLGVVYVPQGHRVFGELSVRENLLVAQLRSKPNEPATDAVQLFPELLPKLALPSHLLSGGEKQMLALAMALGCNPALLLADEPSLGLAPSQVSKVLDRIAHMNRTRGLSVLIVEQKVREALAIAHRVVCLRNGLVSFTGAADDLKEPEKLRQAYF